VLSAAIRGARAAALAACVAAGAAHAAGPAGERPAPPDRFELQVRGGARHTGPVARIDIRHGPTGAPPAVEISFTASDGQGHTWSAVVAPPPAFLHSLALQAGVTDRPLQPGGASVQRALPGGAVQMAAAGTLQLALRQGRLVGEARLGALGDLQFGGPYAVSCTAPGLQDDAAAGATDAAPGAQRVDERFESALCRPYAALGRGG